MIVPEETDYELPDSPFDRLLGTEWLSDDPDAAGARLRVRDDLKQPIGLLHGGVYSSLIESLCSRATALAVLPERIAVGQSINVHFLRSATDGGIEVRARARHRGRSSWVWDADVFDLDGNLCATAKMTMAVRPLPSEIAERYGDPER